MAWAGSLLVYAVGSGVDLFILQHIHSRRTLKKKMQDLLRVKSEKLGGLGRCYTAAGAGVEGGGFMKPRL